MRSKGSLRQHLPFPPAPFPDAGKGGSISNLYIKMRLRLPYQRRLIPLREAVALAFRAGQKGSPQGRKTLWGEEDAPQRGGLPKVKHRVSPTQAEVASDERTGL